MLKWAGLVASFLVLIALVASMRWWVSYANGKFWWLFACGAVDCVERPGYREPLNWSASGWAWSDSLLSAPILPRIHLAPQMVFVLPLWMPFVLVLLPTVHLWEKDRPKQPGHCQQCGYDLTGNVSRVCPECGTPVERV